MNMTNIINSIRRNWIWCCLILLLFTISSSKNFIWVHQRIHLPELSWWNALWILLPFSLGCWASMSKSTWPILRPIRWLCWPGQKQVIEAKFKLFAAGNPMVYPALIWLEGTAEKAFLHGGLTEVHDSFGKHNEGIKDELTNIATTKQPATEDHNCDCQNPECAHRELTPELS